MGLDQIAQYSFLMNALLAAVLSGVACGVVGTYIVSRRLVFMSGGITHSSFGGIGIAYYLGMNPVMGAMVFAVMSALGIEALSGVGRGRGVLGQDSAIGILWSLGMAVGIIFVFLTPGYAPNLMSFLFGNILLVTGGDLLWLLGFDVLIVGLFGLFYRTIIFTALDGEYARGAGVAVRVVNGGMLVLVAVGIVLNIQVVGIVMLISLLTIPVAIVEVLTHSYWRIMLFSSVVAMVGTVLGLVVSYNINIPASATTIVVLAVAYGLVWGSRWLVAFFRR